MGLPPAQTWSLSRNNKPTFSSAVFLLFLANQFSPSEAAQLVSELLKACEEGQGKNFAVSNLCERRSKKQTLLISEISLIQEIGMKLLYVM